ALVPAVAHAAETQKPDAPREVARESAPVKVANRAIIVLRGPIAGYTAKERASSATARIEAALAANANPVVTTEPHEYGTRVALDGRHVFLVLKIDIDEQAGETTQNVAQEAARRLQNALAEYREQRAPRYLAQRLGFAALATLLYGALLWLVYRLNGWI